MSRAGTHPDPNFWASEQHLERKSEQLVTNSIHIRWTNGGSLMPNPVEVVRQFCALMEKRDPEALRPLLANGAVYQNVGMPAFTGVESILENMGAQFSMFPDAYAFEIVNIASDGPVVLTERLDYIKAPDGTKPAVPVMGTFVVDDDGKIARWTDYFDVSLTVKLLQGEDISALVPAAST